MACVPSASSPLLLESLRFERRGKRVQARRARDTKTPRTSVPKGQRVRCRHTCNGQPVPTVKTAPLFEVDYST